MPTFNNNESGASVRAKTNAAITIVDKLSSELAGEGLSMLGLQDAADHFPVSVTNPEEALAYLAPIVNDLEDELGGVDTDSFMLKTDATRVFAFNAGGAYDATVPNTYTVTYIFNWHENGHDAPSDAGPNDMYDLPRGLGIISPKTANHTFADADVGTIVRATQNTLTFTIANEATAPVKYGNLAQPRIGILNNSGNPLTIAAGAGVTLNGAAAGTGSVTIPDGGSGLLLRVTADEWVYTGDTA